MPCSNEPQRDSGCRCVWRCTPWSRHDRERWVAGCCRDAKTPFFLMPSRSLQGLNATIRPVAVRLFVRRAGLANKMEVVVPLGPRVYR